MNLRAGTYWNGAYFPIAFNTEEDLLNIVEILNNENIYPRRYFYPSLNVLPYIEYKELTQAESLSKRVLCLPVYDQLMKDSHISKLLELYEFNN